MSFAADARSEIAHIECTSRCCARSELCAALLASGGISYHGRNKYRLSLMASDATIVRRYFTQIKKYFDITDYIKNLPDVIVNGNELYKSVNGVGIGLDAAVCRSKQQYKFAEVKKSYFKISLECVKNIGIISLFNFFFQTLYG